MRFVGNIIWFVFGGAIIALGWLIGGALAALTIIGLPLSRAAFEMAKLSAFPFGKDVVHVRELDGKGTTAVTALTGTIGFVVNILWACTFGVGLFLGYMIAGIINCIFIITIPFGLQSFKLAGLSFWPVGRRVVTKELANAVRQQNAAEKLERIRSKKTNLPEAV
jgi:uncharacterized membrane protein YccF (DUF307 family)